MISRKELKRRAKLQLGGRIFDSKWMMALLVCLIVELVVNAMNLPGICINLGKTVQAAATMLQSAQGLDLGALPFGNTTINFTFVSGIGTAALLILSGPMNYGLQKMFLKQAREGGDMVLSDLLCGFKEDFGTNILIGLMTYVFTTLWSLLFIIPGIVKAIAYSLALYIKADHPDYDWKTCINESKRLTKGHKGELFMLGLSFLGWEIVGALCLGIGTLWVQPYYEATQAHFYATLAAADAQNAAFDTMQPDTGFEG